LHSLPSGPWIRTTLLNFSQASWSKIHSCDCWNGLVG